MTQDAPFTKASVLLGIETVTDAEIAGRGSF
jgi:hypothetical protein